ncbi:hypothetical protein Tco_0464416 [Tanacetum coccineum]
MYEIFSASSSESLDSIFNRPQKIVSQLTILGEIITPEERNLKFFRSLPTEWGMHVVVWRNKSDLGSISFDDLYNNFKIVEPEVKRSVTSSSNSGSQNLAFVSGHSSTNDDNIANVHVSTGSSPVSTASTNNSTACLRPRAKIHEDDLDEMDLKWQLALLSMKARKFYQRTAVERNPKRQVNRCRINDSSKEDSKCGEASPKAMLAIDGTGFDWSYMAQEGASTNFALMALSDSESDLSNYKRGLASVEERLVFYKKNESMLNDQIDVLKRDASYKDSDINGLEKPCGIVKFKEPEFEGYGVKVTKSASENVSKEVKKTSDAPIIEDLLGFSDCDEEWRLWVINSPYFMVKSWLVQDQIVLGQTETGKESSNPFMAGSLSKTISLMVHISQEVILLEEERTKQKDSEVCKNYRLDETSSIMRFQALLRRLEDKIYFQLYSLVQER